MRWTKPPPSLPTRLAAGTRTSSKNSSAVSCALMPTLSRLRPRSKPGMPRSTASSEKPCAPLSGSVRATTSTRSALMPLVMNVLDPLSTQSEPSRRAVVRSPCRSEPAPGSLMAMAVIISPVTNGGSQRCFCSSVVRRSRYGATTSLCSVKPTPLAPARVSSSPIDALVAEVRDPAAAELLGDVGAEQPLLARLQPHAPVDDAGLLPLGVERHDLLGEEGPHHVAEGVVLGLVQGAAHAGMLATVHALRQRLRPLTGAAGATGPPGGRRRTV